MLLTKTLMAALGLGVIPHHHNKDVHDSVSLRTAILSGQASVFRLQRVIARAEAQGRTDLVERASKKQSMVRQGLDDLTRRLG